MDDSARAVFDCVLVFGSGAWDSPDTDTQARSVVQWLSKVLPVVYISNTARQDLSAKRGCDDAGVETICLHGLTPFEGMRSIAEHMNRRGWRSPLVWVSATVLPWLISTIYGRLKVLHLSDAWPALENPDSSRREFEAALRACDVVVDGSSRGAGNSNGSPVPVLTRPVISLGSIDRPFASATGDACDFIRRLAEVRPAPMPPTEELNVLILFDPYATHTSTVSDHLESFVRFSSMRVCYADGTRDADCDFDLELFQIVIIHYSVRLSLTNFIAPKIAEALRCYAGLKVLFIQDEYDQTNIARDWIGRLGIQVVYTCVPAPYISKVYGQPELAATEFLPTLTGYVPLSLERRGRMRGNRRHFERALAIAYRGRALPWWYGHLGQEKQTIGVRMREICESRGIAVDIEWDDSHRIYGDAWFEFLASARATLGTESGSNVFDDDGSLRSSVERLVREQPMITYEEIHRRLLEPEEGRIRMNQVSPKIFEAIACRTALILFEGEYSGVIKPEIHYIPLKKDFSNVEEVLSKLLDDDYLNGLVERAYQDVIASDCYSYRRFISNVERTLREKVRHTSGVQFATRIYAARIPSVEEWRLVEIAGDPDSEWSPVPVPASLVSNPLGGAGDGKLAGFVRTKNVAETPERALRYLIAVRLWRLLPVSLRTRFWRNAGRSKAAIRPIWQLALPISVRAGLWRTLKSTIYGARRED